MGAVKIILHARFDGNAQIKFLSDKLMKKVCFTIEVSNRFLVLNVQGTGE